MLLGHENKVTIFKKLAEENNLSHAYLFFGDQQIGKFLFAKSLAYFLEFGKFEISEELLIDAHILSANEKNIIGIEEIRNLKGFLWQTPLRSKKRTVIINDAEKLTPEAQSALLKIVEEPPSHALLIFIAAQTQMLFPPLLSRLIKVYFPRHSRARIKEILAEHFNLESVKAQKIADASFGRLGRALNALNGQEKNFHDPEIETILEEKILALAKRNLIKNSENLSRLLERQILLKRYNLNPALQAKAVEILSRINE